jgi:ariadne-1
MQDKVNEISDMLGLSEDDAISILRHFKWNIDKLQNEWFAKEKQLRLQIGIEFDKNIALKNPAVNSSLASINGGYCMICYNKFSSTNVSQKAISLSCGH